jgi:ABC-type polysaccharide/polyol phosphate export permease
VLLTLLFYATPIIYAADRVPEGYRWLTYANPLAPIMEGWRSILLEGELPAVSHLTASAGLTVVALALGWAVFRRLEDGFADAI